MESFDEKVLVVDDEPDWVDATVEAVTKAGYVAVAAGSAAEAEALMAVHKIFLVLADLVMPEVDGITLCQKVRATSPALPFILITARADRERAIAGLRAGVTDIIDKPFSHDALGTTIRNHAMRRAEALAEEHREAAALLAIFIDEARDQLVGVEESLLRLEDDPRNKSEIDRLFRKIHTIKGSSGSVKKAEGLTPLAHAIESLLTRLKDGALKPSGAITDLLLSATDLLSGQLKAIEGGTELPDAAQMIRSLQGATERPPDQVKAPSGAGDKGEVRSEHEVDAGVYVPTDKLDSFMEMVGELIAVKGAFHMFYREPGYLSEAALASAKEVAQSLDKVSDRIQSQLMEIRKVTLKKVFAKLPRIVRQVCVEIQKDAALEIIGEEVSVDKSVANVLSGSLAHAIRNSLDHGIEAPEARRQAGKPAKGSIAVKAEDLSDIIRITVMDDGRGVDRERVLTKAIDKGLVQAHDAARLSDEEILAFLFAPGFSTAAQVTNISGRGVGMDAIQTAIQSCGGTVVIEAPPGAGMRLIMTLPVLKSINVERSILLESSGSLYAVPLKSVSSISTVHANEITPLKSCLSFQYQGKATRVASYGELAAGRGRSVPKSDAAERLVIVISGKRGLFGLAVDRVIGQFDAVIRPFNRLVTGLRGFEGTAVVGNGKLAYVVAAEEMIDLATAQHGRPSA